MKISTNAKNFVKIVQGMRVQGVYIPKFDFKIRKIFISLGHTPHQWDEIWRGGVDLRPNFTPPVQRVPPCGAKKTQNRPPNRTK